MTELTVRHVTTYRYRHPVAFGEHRMMFRPQESYDQRLLDMQLKITPEPVDLRWIHDVFGNCVAIARFGEDADELRFESNVRLDHLPQNVPDFRMASYARTYPFTYGPEEMPDLARSIERHYFDPDHEVDRWVRQFLGRGAEVSTGQLLMTITHAIKESFTYMHRHETGAQDPITTLTTGRGTCRDFAVLMLEAVRALGLAARFVSGYLYVPNDGGRVGGGNTHAWVQVYLPGGVGRVRSHQRHHRQSGPDPGGRRARSAAGYSPLRHVGRFARRPSWHDRRSGRSGSAGDTLRGRVGRPDGTARRSRRFRFADAIRHPSCFSKRAGEARRSWRMPMQIRCGFDIAFECPQPTPMLLMLSVHPSRLPDLISPQHFTYTPPTTSRDYHDSFGNICTRVLAPVGRFEVKTDFLIHDIGLPDEVAPDAQQHLVEDLPDEVLVYLLGSRYCDTEHLLDVAWKEFGSMPKGWPLVQAIVDYTHDRITFGYQHASGTRTAFGGYSDQLGVCRDFAHLAITLCRCMNIPARYCTGYLGDIGVPKDPAPMDFSAWIEVFLGGRWYTFDARHNTPRIGRIVMGRGRDATDVALSTIFGQSTLAKFHVVTDEVLENAA